MTVADDSGFHTAINLIYGAALNPDGWDRALEHVAHLTGSAAVRLSIFDADGAVLFARATGPVAPAADGASLWSSSGSAPGSCRESASGRGLTMLLHRAPSGHGATLSVARRPGGGAYTNGQRALFERLGQHVRDATRIMISLLVKDEMLRTVTWALDHWPSAAFLLSASGHVVQSNHAARRMVERADGLEIIAGRLVARHEHEQAILARLLAEAVASGQALDPAAHLAVTGTLPPRRLELTLQAIPSGEMLRGWNQSPPAVIVLVSDPTDRALRRSQLLSTTYRLTPTESKLVAMIAVGHNVSQLAQQLGLSKETIRSHLKRIFAKAGVNRQSQLIYLLASDAPLPARRSRTPDERGFEALSCRMA